MEQYWDCSLCRIENKARAFRCRSCLGKLQGRERLLREVAEARKIRRVGAWLSAVAAGLGQIYQRRWATGFVLALFIPLAIGLVAATWSGPTYGHLFIVAAAVFVLAVAALDAWHGPTSEAAPCQQTCPVHLDIPDYLQLCLDGDRDQAYSLIRTRVPLVGVIGRICPRPCEGRCLRGIDGEPIAINGCKRFLADTHREGAMHAGIAARQRVVVVEGGKPSVGVVGSGPASLACSYYLTVLGAQVTVYEADEVLGGRLATSIPDYRLPPYIVEEEIEDLRDQGVTFLAGCRVGPEGRPVEELLREHAALFLGVGAQNSLGLEIPGAEFFLDFQEVLRGAKRGTPVGTGQRVAVVGGGNAAVDVCRTALRLGAEEVHLLYRRSRGEMPARPDEVEEALKEGAHLHLLTDPVAAMLDGGKLRGLRLQRMALGEIDASGRPRPVPVPGREWELEVNSVIPALGQRVDGSLFDAPPLRGIRREEDGRIWVDPGHQQTSIDRVYAGGDAVSGPATAVHAMAQGRKAALGIYGALVGDTVPSLRLTDRRLRRPWPGHREMPQEKIREEMPKLSLWARQGNCREVEEGFRESSACREAGRCLQCHRGL